MESEMKICPFCRKTTTDNTKCSSCGSDLLREFVYNGHQYEVVIDYVEREWIPTEYYNSDMCPILKTRIDPVYDIEKAIMAVLNDAEIPKLDLVTIRRFRIFSNFDEHPVIQVWCRRGNILFNATKRYAEQTGIYLHITGPSLPRALISQWFDRHCETITRSQGFHSLKPKLSEKNVFLKAIANESNQTCNVLEIAGLRILLDAGFYWPEEGTKEFEKLTMYLRYDKLDLVVISHAHADHIRGLRKLYNEYGCKAPILLTRATFELSVLRDEKYNEAHKITRETLSKDPAYEKLNPQGKLSKEIDVIGKALDGEFERIISKLVIVTYGDRISSADGSFEIEVLQAGHFPGAIMTVFKQPDYSVVYTGDFNLLEFEPIASSRTTIRSMRIRPNAVICDGSAADLSFPKESLTRARLYSDIMETWNEGKTILLISDSNLGSIVTYFALRESVLKKSAGRIPFYFDETTWDQMCMLRERIDDLAQSVQEKISQHVDPFHSVMIRGLESTKPHLGGIGIKEAASTPCVICVDMVLHGIIPKDQFQALKTILGDPGNLVIIAGAPRSSGTQDLISHRDHIDLKSEGTAESEEIPVNCQVLNWHMPSHQIFNYHPDRDQLMEFFDNVMPEKVVFFHTSPNSLIDLRQDLSERPYIKDHNVIHRRNPVIQLRCEEGQTEN